MRACLVWVTHLLCLSSMCCLPEWNIVNNNNKYTEYKFSCEWNANKHFY